jgi:phosphohistidine phosphatase SixA
MIARLLASGAAMLLVTQSAVAGPTIFLARHAEKAEAAADAKNPDLSPAGRARAESLARMLKDAGIVAVFATEFARTQQTAEEVRRATGADLTIVPAKDTPAVVEKLKAVSGNAVVIGHSNTVPEIIKALGVEQAITIAESEYDNLFILNPSAPGDLVRLRY